MYALPPRYVIWSRIDQKTCLKAILAANLEPVVIALRREGDQLVTDTAAVQGAIGRLGADNVVCVTTTTSCFAPRAADDVVAVAKMCAAAEVPHIVNNAFGVQSASLCSQVTRTTMLLQMPFAAAELAINLSAPSCCHFMLLEARLQQLRWQSIEMLFHIVTSCFLNPRSLRWQLLIEGLP